MLGKLSLWLLFFSLPASAASLLIHVNEGLDLRDAVVNNGAPDLRVLSRELYAAKGIRVDEPGAYFRPTVPLKLGATYVVHGPLENEYLVKVEAAGPDRLRLDVQPRMTEQSVTLRARFQLKSYLLGALPLASTLPDLRLFTDGSYRIGSVTGRWTEAEGHLSLDGYYAAWGLGEEVGEKLTFKFPRAGTWLEVRMERQPAEVAAAPGTHPPAVVAASP